MDSRGPPRRGAANLGPNYRHLACLGQAGRTADRSPSLAYLAMDSLPRPSGKLLHAEAFWTESLLRAMLSRSYPGQVQQV